MLDLASGRLPTAATEAESLDGILTGIGALVLMIVPAHGRPYLAFHFPILPPAAEATSLAAVIRKRFFTEPQFARDLFGHLVSAERVFVRRPWRGHDIPTFD